MIWPSRTRRFASPYFPRFCTHWCRSEVEAAFSRPAGVGRAACVTSVSLALMCSSAQLCIWAAGPVPNSRGRGCPAIRHSCEPTNHKQAAEALPQAPAPGPRTCGVLDERVDIVTAVVPVQLVLPPVLGVPGADVVDAQVGAAHVHVRGGQRSNLRKAGRDRRVSTFARSGCNVAGAPRQNAAAVREHTKKCRNSQPDPTPRSTTHLQHPPTRNSPTALALPHTAAQPRVSRCTPPARRRRPAPPCRTPQRTWFSRTSPTAALPGPCAVRVLERMAAKGPRATWMSPPLGPKSNCTRLPSGCLKTVM